MKISPQQSDSRISLDEILHRDNNYNWQLDKKYVQVNGAIIFKKTDTSLSVFYINASAAILWLMANGTKSIREILNGLPGKYHTSVLELLEQLISKRMMYTSDSISSDLFEDYLLSCNHFCGKPKILHFTERTLSSEMQWENDFRMFFDRFRSHSQFYRPIKLNIDITNRCNLRCTHCYYYSGQEICDSKDLSLEEIKIVVDKMVVEHIDMLNLFGGEPLLHPELVDILKYAASKKIKISINTNGTLISDKILPVIKRYNCHLILSLDGHNAKSHDAIRGDGAFQRLIDAISLLQEYQIPYSIYHVIHSHNVFDFWRLYLLTNRLKVDVVGILFVSNLGRTASLNKVIPMGAIINKAFCATIRLFNIALNLLKLRLTKIYISRCDSYMYAHVGVSGAVNFCQLAPDEITFGNIVEDSISEVWRSQNYTSFYNMQKIEGLCQNCIFRHRCQRIYRCRLQDWSDNSKNLFSGPGKCLLGSFSKQVTRIVTRFHNLLP